MGCLVVANFRKPKIGPVRAEALVRIPDETIEYWGDQFRLHGLQRVMKFSRFIALDYDRKRAMLGARARA